MLTTWIVQQLFSSHYVPHANCCSTVGKSITCYTIYTYIYIYIYIYIHTYVCKYSRGRCGSRWAGPRWRTRPTRPDLCKDDRLLVTISIGNVYLVDWFFCISFFLPFCLNFIYFLFTFLLITFLLIYFFFLFTFLLIYFVFLFTFLLICGYFGWISVDITSAAIFASPLVLHAFFSFLCFSYFLFRAFLFFLFLISFYYLWLFFMFIACFLVFLICSFFL